MQTFDQLIKILEFYNNQAQFNFDKLHMWFLFFATFHATGLLSGFLGALKSESNESDELKNLKNKISYWASFFLLASCYLGGFTCILALNYFTFQKGVVLDFQQNELLSIIISQETHYNTFIGLTLLILVAIGMLGFFWQNLRVKQNYRFVLSYVFKKEASMYKNKID